jgi:Putative transposase
VAADEEYLFPYLVLSRLFRGKFMAGLVHAYRHRELDLGGDCEALAANDVFAAFKDGLYRKDWVVYQKPPFRGPRDVYRYLGRYTHRIAISNHRLQSFDQRGVCFRTKHGKTVTLKGEEFVRRFLLHVLPKRFVKIRHYGLMAARSKARHERACTLLQAAAPAALEAPSPIEGQDSQGDAAPHAASLAPDLVFDNRCPVCLTGTLVSRPLPAGLGRPPPSHPQ